MIPHCDRLDKRDARIRRPDRAARSRRRILARHDPVYLRVLPAGRVASRWPTGHRHRSTRRRRVIISGGDAEHARWSKRVRRPRQSCRRRLTPSTPALLAPHWRTSSLRLRALILIFAPAILDLNDNSRRSANVKACFTYHRIYGSVEIRQCVFSIFARRKITRNTLKKTLLRTSPRHDERVTSQGATLIWRW